MLSLNFIYYKLELIITGEKMMVLLCDGIEKNTTANPSFDYYVEMVYNLKRQFYYCVL